MFLLITRQTIEINVLFLLFKFSKFPLGCLVLIEPIKMTGLILSNTLFNHKKMDCVGARPMCYWFKFAKLKIAKMLVVIIKQRHSSQCIVLIIQVLQVPSWMFSTDRTNQNDCADFITHIISSKKKWIVLVLDQSVIDSNLPNQILLKCWY